MPFKSEAQRRYLWANEPEIARDWTDTYGNRIQKNNGGIMRLPFRYGGQGGGADAGGVNSPGGGTFGGDVGGGNERGGEIDRMLTHTFAVEKPTIGMRTNDFFDGLGNFVRDYAPLVGKKSLTNKALKGLGTWTNNVFGSGWEPHMGPRQDMGYNLTQNNPFSSREGEGIIPILPKTYTDYYANVDQNLYDDDETVDEVQDFIQRFRVDDPYRQQPGTTDTPITYT